jgi:hypothetical protein
MNGIDEYVRILFYREVTKLDGVPTGYVRRSEISARILANVEKILAAHKVTGITDGNNVAEQVFDDLVAAGIVNEVKDKFAGSYFRYIPDEYSSYRQSTVTGSEIYRMSKLVGAPYFPDVFSAYSAQALSGEKEMPEGFRAPPSDKIVDLDKARIAKIDTALSHLIEVIEKDPDFPDTEGVRRRLLGQFKAGRELILAGSFRPYLLYATLLRALGELAARYQESVIGIAARKLIDLLFDLIFKAD